MRYVICLLALLFTAPVQAQDVLTGRLGVFTFPDSAWWDQWMRFQARINFNPEIDLEFFMAGELGSEQTLLTGARRNRIQVISVSGQGIASVVPAFSVIMTPFLFDSYEEADFVFDTYLAEPVREMLAAEGLVVLRYVETGWTIIYAKDRPILRPADMRGLTFRVAPNIFGEAFMRSLNADFAALDLADLVPGLQTGLLDGGITNVTFVTKQLADLVTHVTQTNHTYETGAILASKRWFDGATPSQQNGLLNAYDSLEDLRAGTRTYVDSMIRQASTYGLVYHELSDEDRAVWKAESAEALDIILEVAGPEGEDLWALIQEGKRAFAER